MNFRVVATEKRTTLNGTTYDHTVWMGEFDGLVTEESEAEEFALDRVGPGYEIQFESLPTILH